MSVTLGYVLWMDTCCSLGYVRRPRAPNYKETIVIKCDQCSGTGYVFQKSCSKCDGSGMTDLPENSDIDGLLPADVLDLTHHGDTHGSEIQDDPSHS